MKFLKWSLAFKPTCFKTNCSAECWETLLWALSLTTTKIELHTYILFWPDEVVSDCVFKFIWGNVPNKDPTLQTYGPCRNRLYRLYIDSPRSFKGLGLTSMCRVKMNSFALPKHPTHGSVSILFWGVTSSLGSTLVCHRISLSPTNHGESYISLKSKVEEANSISFLHRTPIFDS